ncbi:MAG: hypothetical protein SPD90_00435 [Intestinibacter sp.]|uniref:hypothetical protein n=1 Tax=Intestinibacter sp. TaxID=1965304 RepID=UPI002A83CCC1|nr:hypothetical protein [Intestinibacter sp.]MDY4573503.1 hypothetical protein [Intestinibacter sp.]
MKKIDEINKKVKEIYEELKELEESMKNEKTKEIDFNYFRGAAKQNAFKDHILKDENEYIQKNYLYLLSSLLMFDNKEDIKNSQIMYISRLIEGFSNKSLDIENIYSNTMIMNGSQISNCIEVIKEYMDVFVVDSLICANIKGKANDQILEYLSEIYFIMGFKLEQINELMNLCNAILENKPEYVFKIKNKNIENYKHHINRVFKEKVFYDFEKINQNDKDDVILLNYTLDMTCKNLKSKFEIQRKVCGNFPSMYIVEENEKFNINMNYYFNVNNIEDIGLNEGYINLDKYHFNSIKFVNCHFNGILGIKGNSKNIEFINCCFENIKVNYIYHYRKDDTYEYMAIHDRITPIDLSNTYFENCEIKNCKFIDERTILINKVYHIMIFNNCEFKNVKFIDCIIDLKYDEVSIAEECSMLKFLKSKLYNCEFIDNISFRYDSMIKMKDSYINQSIFKQCKLLDSRFNDYAIKLNNSKVLNSIFEDCCCRSSRDWKGKTRIIGYMFKLENKSIEENNKFINCEFEKIK